MSNQFHSDRVGPSSFLSELNDYPSPFEDLLVHLGLDDGTDKKILW